jgi:hypothetical protein
MLIALALLSSVLLAVLLADAMPTRALGRTPAPARVRRAIAWMPLVAVVQFFGLALPLGPAAAVAGTMLAAMLAGWLYTLALEHRPRRVRAIGQWVGGVATALTAVSSLAQWTQ